MTVVAAAILLEPGAKLPPHPTPGMIYKLIAALVSRFGGVSVFGHQPGMAQASALLRRRRHQGSSPHSVLAGSSRTGRDHCTVSVAMPNAHVMRLQLRFDDGFMSLG